MCIYKYIAKNPVVVNKPTLVLTPKYKILYASKSNKCKLTNSLTITPYLNSEANFPCFLLFDHDMQDPMSQRQMSPLGIIQHGNRVLMPLLQITNGVVDHFQSGMIRFGLVISVEVKN